MKRSVITVALAGMVGFTIMTLWAQPASAADSKQAQGQMPVITEADIATLFADDKPLRVNGIEITRATIQAAYTQLQARAVVDTPASRLVIRNELIAKELMRQKAESQGLANTPAVQQAIERARTNVLVEAYVKANVKVEVVSDVEVKSEFEKTKASLGAVEYKPRIIVFKEMGVAKQVADELKAQNINFELAAQKYSQHSSASRGGELDWISFKLPAVEGKTNGLSLQVANALAALAPGEISAVISENKHWILLKQDAIRPTVIPSYEQAAPALRQLLEARAQERAMVKLVTDLVANAKIEQ